MDELNKLIEKHIDEVGYFFTHEFSDIKKASEIILSVGEPRYTERIKTGYGLTKSIDLSYQFFNSLDKSYGDYFQERLNEGGFDFKLVKSHSYENAVSTYDYNQGKKTIYIPYCNQITDAFSIVHETFHDANLDIENLNYTRSLFTEYISIFGEFLFEKFISDNFDIKCKAIHNTSFAACYPKALKVDFQLNLFKCYLENGFVNKYSFDSIVNSYPKRYHALLIRFYRAFIEKNDFDFDYQMRYLFGILLSCYSYDNFLNGEFSIDNFKFIHEKINDLFPEEVYAFLDLEVIDDYTLLLSPDSYDKLDKSYRKIMKRR